MQKGVLVDALVAKDNWGFRSLQAFAYVIFEQLDENLNMCERRLDGRI